MPVILRSRPSRGAWNSNIKPVYGSVSKPTTVSHASKRQSPVHILNDRVSTSPEVKEAAEQYAKAANNRSLKPHRQDPTDPVQRDARVQALRLIELRNAGRRRS